jgi:Carboxypeptidase regulatory-like domain/TonB dependent receptor
MKIGVAVLTGFVAVISSVPVLSAQEVTASITGRITDAQGAAIVGASVTMKETDRGTDWPTKTNSEGIYVFPRLPVGNYDLRVEAPGFKASVKAGIRLEVNLHTTFDIALQVGATSESVSVTAEAPLLQTDSNQVGGVIAAATIENLPLISRNPVALTLLNAGVTTPDPSSFNSGQRSTGGGRPYVNGNREEANNFMLDGLDNNFTSDNLVAYQPNPDAIEEFRLITNNASAEFGNYQGGVINVVMKSGTNQYHGNVFEDFRNDKLNANNWANNWNLQPNGQATPRPPLRWNQFGGTFGGPIKKDKLFFFMDYEGLRKAVPPAVVGTVVMPAAWRKGDFSSMLNGATTANGKPVQLYNPYALNTTTGQRDPFPNNVIPATLLSPAAVKLLNNTSLYPLPQNNTITSSNYFYGSSSQLNMDQGDIKLDYRPEDKDYFSFRYSNGRQDAPGLNTFPLFYNSFNTSPFENGVINWTRTFKPNLINEARFGGNYILLNNGGADKGLGDIALAAGIAAAGPGLLNLTGFAYAAALGSANIGTQQLFANTTWQLTDNMTWIKGKHVIKFGFDEQRRWINVFYSGNNGRSGFIDFNGRFTSQTATSTSGSLGEADFMLGLPDQLGRGLQSGTWGQRSWVTGIFVQDDYRITKNLTLNLGLRYQYNTPWVEVENRQSNFGLITGTLYLAGQAGCPYSDCRALYNAYKKDWQPRVGFAYAPQLFGKGFVIRGGYAISSYLEGTGTNLRMPLNPPFESEFQTYYNTPQYSLPGSTLDQGLSGLNPKNPYVGATIRLWDPGVRPAESQQWNLSTEYGLGGGNVLTVGYVGQHSTHLMVAMPYLQNMLVNGAVVQGPYLSGNPTLRGEISQISGTCSCANQKYDGLQTTLRKRFSAGFEYQVAFTYSKGMSDSIGYYGQGGQAGSQSAYMQNLYNRVAEWSPTYFDNKFNFVPSAVYELPFGKGHKYASNMNRGAEAILGGWKLSGVLTTHTGFPLTIKVSGDPSGTGARSFRANVVGTPNNQHLIGPGVSYLDLSAYAVPAPFTFGNSGPGVVRGPGEVRLDMTLGKRFNVTEHKYFELRAETYGLTNTPIYASPASQTITSALFGQIRSSQGERQIQMVLKFYF